MSSEKPILDACILSSTGILQEIKNFTEAVNKEVNAESKKNMSFQTANVLQRVKRKTIFTLRYIVLRLQNFRYKEKKIQSFQSEKTDYSTKNSNWPGIVTGLAADFFSATIDATRNWNNMFHVLGKTTFNKTCYIQINFHSRMRAK